MDVFDVVDYLRAYHRTDSRLLKVVGSKLWSAAQMRECLAWLATKNSRAADLLTIVIGMDVFLGGVYFSLTEDEVDICMTFIDHYWGGLLRDFESGVPFARPDDLGLYTVQAMTAELSYPNPFVDCFGAERVRATCRRLTELAFCAAR